jgi:hypothetical protein
MTHSLRTCISAGALGAALLAGSLIPTQAAEAAPSIAQAAAQAQSRTYPGESFAQYGRRGGYYGRGYGYRGGYYRRGYGGGALAAGVVGGLAVGALAGAAIANSQPAPGYYGYGGGAQPVGNIYGADPNWVNYCASKYRSFDPRSGTYLASDGYRYPCQ